MAIPSILTVFFLVILIPASIAQDQNSTTLETYIVHVHQTPGTASISSIEERTRWYESFLPASIAGLGEKRLIYSYSEIISGFAVKLTSAELAEMSYKEGFTYAYPNTILTLATTHSPSFLGLQNGVAGFWEDSEYGKGVIIGVLDTGIAPDHPSFDDAGMPPPPARWKGSCEFNETICNNKLIGARSFVEGSTAMVQSAKLSQSDLFGPYDGDGHGTHTAGTAAGAFVESADINGLANGTAVGVAPYAHLAIYKVCGDAGCSVADILAGMDSAVNDGVDVISMSIAGSSQPFYSDGTAIGAMGAIQNGVFVSCAAGNNGPDFGSLSNEAPWILTVGASTMDRLIRTTVKLGSDETFFGESAYQPSTGGPATLPLVYPGGIAGFCTNGSLDNFDVKDKVVLCDTGSVSGVTKGMVVKAAGGAGIIIANQKSSGATTSAEAHVLPASHVSYEDGQKIKAYIRSASAPTASILFDGTLIGTTPAPALADFSSRGPSLADENILKPDIVGPGVNVLAAWASKVGNKNFNMISGTSMSTPHLSGIVALIKNTHPTWSPAAIKSAMMTTTYLIANDGNPIVDETLQTANFFGIGAGHVNPSKANNPGLVYDIKPDDYLAYLCGLQYTDTQVTTVAGRAVNCSDLGVILPQDLNYPSFMVLLNANNNYSLEVKRTVTNVGPPNSTYTVEITSPSDVEVDVKPKQLSFSEANQDVEYTVSFTGSTSSSGTYSQGYLIWTLEGGEITVSSPIMVKIE
ncbi:subtilisin-like protease [Typha angustifolia]|uniref:subtilisin-like protease n=1 Tax=Typha angustifolia TaxID=59011 RepID=UPI003C2E59E6